MRTLVVLLAIAGCSSDEDSGPPAIFPETYAATFQEVRSCRQSLEHSANIRILVSPDAVDAYARNAAFPVGSFVLKEEYDIRDVGCTKAIAQFTVMRKLDTQTGPASWEWQKTDARMHEVPEDFAPCESCHSVCGKPPMGYDATCAEP
jgi:hypothetical protein